MSVKWLAVILGVAALWLGIYGTVGTLGLQQQLRFAGTEVDGLNVAKPNSQEVRVASEDKKVDENRGDENTGVHGLMTPLGTPEEQAQLKAEARQKAERESPLER